MISISKNIFTRLLFQKELYRFSKDEKMNSEKIFKGHENFDFVKNVKKIITLELENNLGKEKNFEDGEIFRYENYSFRIFNQDYKELGLNLLTEEFYDQEPLTNSYWRQFPEEKKFGKEIMFEFWSMLIENSINNKLSVMTIDLQRNELIGICIAKDISYIPNGFEKRFIENLNVISSVITLEDEVIKLATNEKQTLFKSSGQVVDIFAGAIRKKHMGKELFYKMIFCNEKLALKQNYQYAFVYATNFKTGMALSKLNYEKVSEIECKEFEFYKIKPFYLIDELNRKPTIWLKKLE